MSAGAGVPPWARPVLEALRDFGNAITPDEQDRAATVLATRCAAALASDAGTPEGEPHALDCAISEVGARHGCTCGVEPLAESGAAPDAELDGLILAHASAVHQHPQDSFALGKTHQAIRAHVEKVKREARAAGERAATGEVVAEGRITAVLPDAEGTYYLSVQVQGNWQDVRSSLRAPVAVVLRRDKEGVCE